MAYQMPGRDAPDEPRKQFRVWRRPLGSLPTRLGFFVLGATLCTSLVITAVSLRMSDTFLRERTRDSFPAILERTASELETWYAARKTDAESFREDPVLASYWNDLSLAPPLSTRARQEIAEQLDRRLVHAPVFVAAFVLDPDDEVSIWRGPKVEISRDMRKEIRHKAFSRALSWRGGHFQIASVTFDHPEGPTLHLLYDLDRLSAILRIHARALEGSISIVGPDGRYLATSAGRLPTERFALDLPAAGEVLEAVDSTGREGQQLITSAVGLPSYGWSLVVEDDYDRAYARVVSSTRRVLGINLTIVALFALVAYRFAVGMVRPIEALSDAARRISEGDKDIRIPHAASTDEVGVLTQAFFEMTSRIEANAQELESAHRSVELVNAELVTRNDELHRANEVLAQLSITDGLTQLHNHRYFQESLAREAKRADRTEDPLSLILIDIDHFKAWNDRLGHAGGDEILRRTSEVMNTLLRSTDLLARYGGEEFALLAPGTQLEGALRLAEKMRTTISRTCFFLDPPSEHQRVTVSMGVALYRGDRKRLFSEADRALYRAKAAGRDCVMVFDDEIDP